MSSFDTVYILFSRDNKPHPQIDGVYGTRTDALTGMRNRLSNLQAATKRETKIERVTEFRSTLVILEDDEIPIFIPVWIEEHEVKTSPLIALAEQAECD